MEDFGTAGAFISLEIEIKKKLKTAIIITIILLISSLTIGLIRIESSAINLDGILNFLRFWGLLIGLISITILWRNSKYQPIKIVISIILIIFFVLVRIYITPWMRMCDWTDETKIYRHITNSKISIVEQDYDCGATTSSEGNIYFKRCQLKNNLILKYRISPPNSNSKKWIKID